LAAWAADGGAAVGSSLVQSRNVPQALHPARKIDAKYDVTKIGNRDIGKGLDFYSPEKEIQLGRQLSQELEQNLKLVKDPAITEYVNRVGQRLVRNSDAKVPFIIKVVQDDEINAYALPGGFFYVNTGLILAADDEAQLAGVMAHEIAHVAARHATRNETRSDIVNLATIPLIFFGGPAGMFVRQGLNLAVPMSFLKFSRDSEREADLLGIQYDYASGYDPEEFVKLFEKLKATERQKQNVIDRAFATHPMTAERIKLAQAEIATYLPQRDDYVIDTNEFQEVRQRVAELTHRRSADMGKLTPVLLKHDVDDKAEHPPMVDATGWERAKK
jgi:predicted Zn-dependent protease